MVYYVIKGMICDKNGKAIQDASIKAFDKSGKLVSKLNSNKEGLFEGKVDGVPKILRFSKNGISLLEKPVLSEFVAKKLINIGKVKLLCAWPPKDWHILGEVRDKMTGDPMPNLRVEALDYDPGGPYYDGLGSDITDGKGEFNIWFDEKAFERGDILSRRPDVILEVTDQKGVLIHRTDVDEDASGENHECPAYCPHWGKSYVLEVDYIRALINRVGPVPVADIDNSGYATYREIAGRPFGDNTTIWGRVWGSGMKHWRLSYASGVIDSSDTAFSTLGGPSGQDPWTTIAQGLNKVWDGPIAKWDTDKLQGLHTLILVVWDQNGVEYHDTQIVFLNNADLSPGAAITSPAPCAVLSKTDSPIVTITGTASADYFLRYYLSWAGNDKTVLTEGGPISYPPAGQETPVIGGEVGKWDISGHSNCAYVVRLGVYDKTILNDGSGVKGASALVTVSIVD